MRRFTLCIVLLLSAVGCQEDSIRLPVGMTEKVEQILGKSIAVASRDEVLAAIAALLNDAVEEAKVDEETGEIEVKLAPVLTHAILESLNELAGGGLSGFEKGGIAAGFLGLFLTVGKTAFRIWNQRKMNLAKYGNKPVPAEKPLSAT